MEILYSPQVNCKKIEYRFEPDKIIATFEGATDSFDFSNFDDGLIEDPSSDIVTILDVNPIVSVKRTEGLLQVVLLNHIDEDATMEECFPVWVEVAVDG